MAPALVLVYIILSVLMLWIIIGSRGHWLLKLILIVAIPTYGFMMWGALESFSGWPTKEKPPPKLLLLQSQIEEPHSGNKGAIYVWGVPSYREGNVFSYKPSQLEPRAYTLPYTRALHQQMEQAKELQKNGATVELSARLIKKKNGKYRYGSKFVLHILPDAVAPLKPED